MPKSISWDGLADGLAIAGACVDCSCDPTRRSTDPPLGSLSAAGGLDGDAATVLRRILEFAKFTPTGRAIVIPDAGAIKADARPFVCSSGRLPDRLAELDRTFPVFDGSSYDRIFVFESGEAFIVNHDLCLLWAKSSAHSRL